MRVVVLSNPRSGRNRAETLARSCAAALRGRGHEVLERSVHDNEDPIDQNTDRAVIVGGDGTVHHTLTHLIEHQTPFLHLPTGTANLIAKEFAMPRRADHAARWVEQGGVTEIDAPTLDGTPFLIMVTLGCDAGVIHRFEYARSSRGGYLNYVAPVVREVLSPRAAHVSIECDGTPLSVPQSANITIANLRAYALGINPCNNADPSDRRLDVAASACSTTLGWSIGSLKARARLGFGTVRARAQRITLTATQDSPVQVDGEIARTRSAPEGILAQGCSVELEVGVRTVRVVTKPVG